MIRRTVSGGPAFVAGRYLPALPLVFGVFALAAPAFAQTTIGPVTVGAGVRTDFDSTNPTGGTSDNQFQLNDVRLYVNGNVTDKIKLMFNTDYNGATNSVQVLDAVARIELAPAFNIWAGRFLPPSDRADLAGPFYASEWQVFTDGVQDGYPSVFQGRDNGMAYWGDFGKKIKMKFSIGAFDGATATTHHDVLGAARVQLDFWDAEGGYYLNRSYYGDKNLLSVGLAGQDQSGHTASTIDFLMERKLGNAGTLTIEGEYSNYNRLGGYVAAYAKSQGAYGLASYLLPKMMGPGRFELLGKYAKADFTKGLPPSFDQKTLEINFDYILKQFNARIQSFYENTRFNREVNNFWQAGLGLQFQI